MSLLVAMDERRGIGLDNHLPWRLSADLKHFKALTMGHHLVMGRKTYESIGRMLPGRTTIVITRNASYSLEGGLVAGSLEEALYLAEARGEDEVFVAGGGEIFALALPLADRLYLTQVHAVTPANIFFPEFDPGEWGEKEVLFHPVDEKNEYAFTIKYLERIRTE